MNASPIARRRRLPPRARKALLAVAVAAALPPAGWALAVRLGTFPRERLAPARAASVTVLDAQGEVLRQDATAAGGRERWVPLGRISPDLCDATVAAEDHRFWRHGGVDPVGLARAAWLDLVRGRAAYGGSTLTMQLARLLEPHPRTFAGKLREAVAAGRIERVASKGEILEQYLNRVYYGHGAWGAEAAARFYFGKPAAALSLGEAAFLAVLPRGPEAYDPFVHLDAALRRRAHILAQMQRLGAATAAERDVAERAPLGLRREHPELRAPHFAEYVLAQLPAAERAGATVETTLDGPLQARLEVALRDHLEAVAARGVTQAGLVVLRNRDGAVLGMVGSRDYFDAAHAGAVNATTIPRRPGSTLKPYVYALALEAGDSPATIAYDVVLPGESRETYTAEVKQHGLGRYREALAGSYNLAAVHTLGRVGPPALAARLRAAGLTTFPPPDERYPLSLAIGEAEFRVIEYAAAFAAFGNEGRVVPPRPITRVRGAGAAAREVPPAEARPVFSAEVAYLVFDMLSDPDARRPMFGSQAPVLDFRVALKTGTTRAYTDDLAFGTTREYTVGAWAGNFDGSPTAGVMAMQGAAPLVRAAFVALASRFGTPTPPAPPATLEHGAVCALSGMLPGPDCPRKRELFAPGTAPRTACTWHRQGHVEFPAELQSWARVHGLLRSPSPRRAGRGEREGLAITYPADGARFLLDPTRPPSAQRPPLRALPAGSPVHWTIDGVAADQFTPRPGTYVVRARSDAGERQISISFD